MPFQATNPHAGTPSVSAVLDATVDGLIVLSGEGRILFANQSVEAMLCHSPGALKGVDSRALVYGDDVQWHQHALTEALGRKPLRLRTNLLRADGSVIPVEMTLSTVAFAADRGIVCVIRDLEETLEVERQLNRLQADLMHMARVSAMNEMGAALAHELNQPLTAAGLYLQAAQGSPQALGADNPLLAKALNEIRRAGTIIQRIRSFVEKKEMVESVVDVLALLEDALDLVRWGSSSKPVVTVQASPDVPQVRVDHVQIEQVILNLLRNAFEAVEHEPEPRIAITLDWHNGRVRLTISDNGPGVPETMRDQLFTAFATSKSNSLGVGLVISRSIAQNHGGGLFFTPRTDGPGASFTLELPPADPVLSAETNRTTQRQAGAE